MKENRCYICGQKLKKDYVALNKKPKVDPVVKTNFFRLAPDQAPDVYRDRPAFPGVSQRGLAAVSPFRGGVDGRREGLAGDAGRGFLAGGRKDRFYKSL